jgi:hypothetical protein
MNRSPSRPFVRCGLDQVLSNFCTCWRRVSHNWNAVHGRPAAMAWAFKQRSDYSTVWDSLGPREHSPTGVIPLISHRRPDGNVTASWHCTRSSNPGSAAALGSQVNTSFTPSRKTPFANPRGCSAARAHRGGRQLGRAWAQCIAARLMEPLRSVSLRRAQRRAYLPIKRSADRRL